MGYIITGAVSFSVGMILFLLQRTLNENKKLKEEQERKEAELKQLEIDRMEALEDGVLCLLRKELICDYEKWTEKGFITSPALENGLLMYDAYKKLGGNGMIDHMKDEIQELHIKQKG